MARPRVVFFGTPAFAVASLEALTEFTDVVAVVCQPDKLAGTSSRRPPPRPSPRPAASPSCSPG
ncbi:MAG: hypothetical protein R3A52_27565 [Polyangiales bacterium]